jgi:tellurite resistance protein TehA-like permease
MPAACFENMNATSSLGLGDFLDLAQNVTATSGPNGTFNASQIQDSVVAATSSMSGLGEYVTLVVFVVLALLFLGMELFEAMVRPSRFLHWVSIVLSTLTLFASVSIAVVAVRRYDGLRSGMEVDEWFVVDKEQKWTFAQLMPMFMLGSGLITLVKAARGKQFLQSG